MNQEQVLLLFYWLIWCGLHSALAINSLKRVLEKYAGKFYRYYRLCYSIFAFVTLGWLLYYQFILPSTLFWENKILRYLSSLPLAISGGLIMVICIKKYFYELSGVQAFDKSNKVQAITLQQSGLHSIVRHPLYLGTLMLVWGIFLYLPSTNNLIACSIISIYVLIGIELEERKLLIEYGDQYRIYQQHVAKLVPGMRRKWKGYKN